MINILSNIDGLNVDKKNTTLNNISSNDHVIVDHYDNIINQNLGDNGSLIDPLSKTDFGEYSLTKLYDKVKHSVVHIEYDSDSPDDLRMGSGFVYDDQGHIITSYRPFEGINFTNEFDIMFVDGEKYKAKIIGLDPLTDITVLRVLMQNNTGIDDSSVRLVPLLFGNFSDVRVGQHVVAVGNPSGIAVSVSEGIVSGLGRIIPTLSTSAIDLFRDALDRPYISIPDVIRTDAEIRPVDWGGPLINMKGEIIGINSPGFSSPGALDTEGFAIPSYLIQQVVPSIIAAGNYEHPFLGISGVEVSPKIANIMNLDESTGILVTNVIPESPAEKVGIRDGNIATEINGRQVELGGDILSKVDGKDIQKMDDLLSYLEREKTVGDPVTLLVIRDGQPHEVGISLTPRPVSYPFGSEFILELQGDYPSLGITGVPVTPEIASEMKISSNIISSGELGLLVIDVIKNSSGYDAGIRGGYIQSYINGSPIELGGDIIMGIDSIPIRSEKDIDKILSTKNIGETIQLTIYRDNKAITLGITLKPVPLFMENEIFPLLDTLPPSLNNDPIGTEMRSGLFDNLQDKIHEICVKSINMGVCDKLLGN